MSQYMTKKQKKEFTSVSIDRHGGWKCFYCNEPLTNEYDIDHLNDNPRDNRFENYEACHHKCNMDKQNNYDYKIMAKEQLRLNEETGYRFLEDENAHRQTSTEMQVNGLVYNFTKQHISERIAVDGEYPHEDAIAEIPYLTQEKYGHGSEVTVRKYIKQLTSKVSKWQVVRDDKGRKIICKRNVLN